MRKKPTALLLGLLLGAGTALAAERAPQEVKTIDTEIKIPVQLKYLVSLPENYTKDGEGSPLMLFLHGAGERGSDINKVKVHGPPKLADSTLSDSPFIIVSPQCPERSWWNPDSLSALLDKVEKDYNVDKSRVYLTGLSMGGYGTWALASAQPERFAAIAPICGGGDPEQVAKNLNDMPIWVFHGAKDSVVGLEQSQRLVDALKEAGAEKVKFTIYPEAQHDSWTETYDNEELYEWLLSHKKKRK